MILINYHKLDYLLTIYILMEVWATIQYKDYNNLYESTKESLFIYYNQIFSNKLNKSKNIIISYVTLRIKYHKRKKI